VIDGSSGQTTGLEATIAVSQGGATSNSVALTISDLPSLAGLGLQPGQLSQAFNTYQTLSLGSNINVQQAIGMMPGASGVPGSLLGNLQSQLQGTISARNVIDNIVAESGYVQPLGSANDGTAINFDQNSAAMLDRILAQYLAVITGQSVANLSIPASAVAIRNARRYRLTRNPAGARPSLVATPEPMRLRRPFRPVARGGLGSFVSGLGLLGGAANVASTGQTFLSQGSSNVDKVLSVASTLTSVVTIGATIVAATAAAPEIAAGAIVVAAWSSLAGVAVGSVMVGNDIYNLSTSLSSLANAASGSVSYATAYGQAQAAFANLVSDTVSTALNAYGAGAVSSVVNGSVLPSAMSIVDQVFAPELSDVAAGLGGLVTTTGNIYAQNQIEEDVKSAQENLGQAPLPSSANPGLGFALLDGNVSISNSNGPVLSPLTGIEAGSSASSDQLSCMADADGDYSLTIPVGSSTLDYSSLVIDAYDPLTSTVLSTDTVDLSGLPADATATAPSMTGSCTDTDATSPDGDDPDCD
jgi:hypothetical protein